MMGSPAGPGGNWLRLRLAMAYDTNTLPTKANAVNAITIAVTASVPDDNTRLNAMVVDTSA